MRIATWNVNSLKARLPRVEEFLGYADVDVLCLQETKLSDKAFPGLTFSGLGLDSVHNGPGQWNGAAIPAQRESVARLQEWGMDDAFRCVYPDVDRLFSYWDYRAGDFHQHRGMRIDLVLATRPVAERVNWAVVDRNARKGTGPSDHAPVIIDLRD